MKHYYSTEAAEQKAVVQWCAYMGIPIVHIPNEGKRSPAMAAKLKRLGLRPGVPDLFLPYPAGGFHGLWLEMKTDVGRPTACQRDWIEYLRSVGYAAYICRGAGEAINAIEAYLAAEGKQDASPCRL